MDIKNELRLIHHNLQVNSSNSVHKLKPERGTEWVAQNLTSPYYSWCPSDLSKASGVSRVDGGFLRLIL